MCYYCKWWQQVKLKIISMYMLVQEINIEIHQSIQFQPNQLPLKIGPINCHKWCPNIKISMHIPSTLRKASLISSYTKCHLQLGLLEHSPQVAWMVEHEYVNKTILSKKFIIILLFGLCWLIDPPYVLCSKINVKNDNRPYYVPMSIFY